MRNINAIVMCVTLLIGLLFVGHRVRELEKENQELRDRCNWQRDKISELILDGLDDETGIVGHPLPWPRPEVPEIGVM